MARPGVNLLGIAARVAHSGCLMESKPGSPALPKVLTKAQRAEAREKAMRQLALDISETEQQVVKLIAKISTLHKLEGKMPPCQWREMMEMLVASLRHWKARHREMELLLRRLVLEPENDALLQQI